MGVLEQGLQSSLSAADSQHQLCFMLLWTLQMSATTRWTNMGQERAIGHSIFEAVAMRHPCSRSQKASKRCSKAGLACQALVLYACSSMVPDATVWAAVARHRRVSGCSMERWQSMASISSINSSPLATVYHNLHAFASEI